MLKHTFSMKRTNIFKLSILSLFSFCIVACSTGLCANKKQFLDNFDTFMQTIRNDEDIDEKQSLTYQDEYKELIENCYKQYREEMTLQERQNFWKESVILYFKTGGKSLDLKLGSNNDEEFNAYVQEELETVIEESGDDFSRILREVVSQNLLPALNDIFKGIENLGKDLQKAQMYDIVLAFITAFLLTFFAIPSIISVANKKGLTDEPGERRAHSISTPSLGGIGIFAGTIFAIILWTPFKYFGDLQYILCAFIIIFLVGAKDDIDPISPKKKFLGQVFAALILIFFSKIRLTSFYGIFGMTEVPFLLSIIVSLFIIILIINAFNLIDGINGLSGSIGVLAAITFGCWFFMVDRLEMASVAFALAGSVIAFLYYNITPAKIFMGDTGSLLIGLVAAILAINFIEHHRTLQTSQFKMLAPPAVAAGILILPLFDTLRVFVSRMIKGRSPFSPDRNHIHHLMLDIGCSHMQATGILLLVNLLFIIVAYKFQYLGSLVLLLILLILASSLTVLIYLIRSKKKNNNSLQNSYD